MLCNPALKKHTTRSITWYCKVYSTSSNSTLAITRHLFMGVTKLRMAHTVLLVCMRMVNTEVVFFH